MRWPLAPRVWLGWHARWWCRRWALEHGEPPAEVVLEQLIAPIEPLAPTRVDFWARARVEPLARIRCDSEPFAQLVDELSACARDDRRRHVASVAARREHK